MMIGLSGTTNMESTNGRKNNAKFNVRCNLLRNSLGYI